jgi:energy-converting hydrogenase B subunit D
MILFLVAIVLAVIALLMHDLLAAIVMMMSYSFVAAVLYALLGAVDVAFTEAAVGAGVSGVFMIAALFYLRRRSDD